MNTLTKQELSIIFDSIGIGQVTKVESIDIGFNHLLFNINDSYILKVCTNPDNENSLRNEIEFYRKSPFDFHPKLISSNIDKENLPFVYLLQEKVCGINLFDVWGDFNESKRKEIIIMITDILRQLHSIKGICPEYSELLNAEISKYIERIKHLKVLSFDQLKYLTCLASNFDRYFIDSEFCFVHGDVHFNNLMYDGEKLTLLDFEYGSIYPIEKEFDSINRMCKDPNSLAKKGNKNQADEDDYRNILGYFAESYSEVFGRNNFDNKVLVYNCINALKWLAVYPNHQLYKDILFEKSKVLIR